MAGAAADSQQLWLLTFHREVNRAWTFSCISTGTGSYVQEQVVLVTQGAVSSLPLLPVFLPFPASHEGDTAPGCWWQLSLYCLLSRAIHSIKVEGIVSAPC